jgi:hypothetical protein
VSQPWGDPDGPLGILGALVGMIIFAFVVVDG